MVRSPPPPDERFLEQIRSAARRVFEGTPVFLAYVYGSRIAGSPSPDSDLDIGYYAGDPPGRGAVSLRGEMELLDRLSRELGLEVDLRDLGPAPLELRGRILETGMHVYSSDEVRRVDLERDILGRYHDVKEMLRRLHEERLRSIAESGL